MFGGVAIAHMHVKHTPPDGDLVALFDPRKAKRQRRDDVGKVEWPLGGAFLVQRGIHPRKFVESQRLG